MTLAAPIIPAIYPAFAVDMSAPGSVADRVVDVRLRTTLDVQLTGSITTGELGLETSIDGQSWIEAAESVTGAGRFSVDVAAACWARPSVLTTEAVVGTVTVGAR